MPFSDPLRWGPTLRDRRYIAITHARSDGIERGFHGAVLHQCGAADEGHFLAALDCLDPVDQLAGIGITRVRQRSRDVGA